MWLHRVFIVAGGMFNLCYGMPPAFGVQSLSHWITGEVLWGPFYKEPNPSSEGSIFMT